MIKNIQIDGKAWLTILEMHDVTPHAHWCGSRKIPLRFLLHWFLTPSKCTLCNGFPSDLMSDLPQLYDSSYLRLRELYSLVQWEEKLLSNCFWTTCHLAVHPSWPFYSIFSKFCLCTLFPFLPSPPPFFPLLMCLRSQSISTYVESWAKTYIYIYPKTLFHKESMQLSSLIYPVSMWH